MVQQEKERYLAGASSDGVKSRGDDEMDAPSTDAADDLDPTPSSNNIINDSMLEESSTGIMPTAVSADIVQMDSVIQEKEEILSKLLDTVKGMYVCMVVCMYVCMVVCMIVCMYV